MYLIEPEVSGGTGPATVQDVSVHPPTIERLEFEFTLWFGDELIEGFTCYLVSDRVRQAIESAQLTGVRFADVEITVDEQTLLFEPEFRERLPIWWWFQPSRVHGNDFYWSDAFRLFASPAGYEALQAGTLDHARVRWLDTPPDDEPPVAGS